MTEPQTNYVQHPPPPGEHQQPLMADGQFWYRGRGPSSRAAMKNWQGTNQWTTSMMASCCAEPKMCLLGFLCQPCCVMQQRKRLLMEDMRNYECCAGIWGPNCTQRCNGCTKGKEDFCLCLESFFCLACAISGNRWMVRQHYNLENDCCDTFLMALACVLRIIGCLLRTDKCENIADCVFHMVISCMLAQHEHQMNVMGYPLGTAPQSPPQAME